MDEISFHGETYPVAASTENFESRKTTWYGETEDDPDRRGITVKFSEYFCVPIGYDGVIGCFHDSAIESEGKYPYEWADENTLFFRLEDRVLYMVME